MVITIIQMKHYIPGFISLLLLMSSFLPASAGDKIVTVTVLEQKSFKPIENATVMLMMAKMTSADQVKKNAKTDAEGRCVMTVETGQDMGWSFMAKKDGYYQVFSKDPNDTKVSSRTFVSEIDDRIVLYLTEDVEHLKAYYHSITPHYNIDTLISQLKADRYSPSTNFVLPDLKWEDIPKLLALGTDQRKITKFTQNPVSSVIQEDCMLGIYVLWLIESIRISYGKPLLEPFKRFPSQRPVLISKTNGAEFLSLFGNTPEQMEIAFIAYDKWWDNAKTMTPGEACKINPLEASVVHW